MQPDVVVTFEPNGGYGHPDHVAIHQITVAAVAAAADPAQYPEQIADGLAPHRSRSSTSRPCRASFFAQDGREAGRRRRRPEHSSTACATAAWRNGAWPTSW